MKRVRVTAPARFVFGQAEWGSAMAPISVAAGVALIADRIEYRPDDADAPWRVSSPLFIEAPNGSRRMLSFVVVDNVLCDDPVSVEMWDAWIGGMGVEDVVPDGA